MFQLNAFDMTRFWESQAAWEGDKKTLGCLVVLKRLGDRPTSYSAHVCCQLT